MMEDPAFVPVPAEILAPDPPLTDGDIEQMLDAVDRMASGPAARFDHPATAVEYFLSDDGLDDEESPGPWLIQTEADAAWVASKLADYDHTVQDLMMQGRAWHCRIDDWIDSRTRRPASGRAWAEALLQRWGREKREADPKGPAHYPLPDAVVKTRQGSTSVDIVDANLVADWLKANRPDDYAVIVEEVRKVPVSKLRKLVTPGTVVVSTDVKLQCGHEGLVIGQSAVGEVVKCDECDELLTDPMIPVVEIGAVRTEPAPVVDGHAGAVPGVRLSPGRLDVTVTVK